MWGIKRTNLYCKLFSLGHDIYIWNWHRELFRTDGKAFKYSASDQTIRSFFLPPRHYYIYHVINNLEKKWQAHYFLTTWTIILWNLKLLEVVSHKYSWPAGVQALESHVTIQSQLISSSLVSRWKKNDQLKLFFIRRPEVYSLHTILIHCLHLTSTMLSTKGKFSSLFHLQWHTE